MRVSRQYPTVSDVEARGWLFAPTLLATHCGPDDRGRLRRRARQGTLAPGQLCFFSVSSGFSYYFRFVWFFVGFSVFLSLILNFFKKSEHFLILNIFQKFQV
jgi:hypothetical protein